MTIEPGPVAGHGGSHDEWGLVFGILRRHPEVERAVLFGSRAKGSARPNSDFDLALWGRIDHRLLARLNAELDELPLPYTFDLVVYGDIRQAELRAHIDRVGRVVYETSAATRGTDS